MRLQSFRMFVGMCETRNPQRRYNCERERKKRVVNGYLWQTKWKEHRKLKNTNRNGFLVWFIVCESNIRTTARTNQRTNQLLLSLRIYEQYWNIQTSENKIEWILCFVHVDWQWHMLEWTSCEWSENKYTQLQNNHTFAEWKMENKNKSVQMTVYVHVQSRYTLVTGASVTRWNIKHNEKKKCWYILVSIFHGCLTSLYSILDC